MSFVSWGNFNLKKKKKNCTERYTACNWMQKAHTLTHFHTLHTLLSLCLEARQPECVSAKIFLWTRERSHSRFSVKSLMRRTPQLWVWSGFKTRKCVTWVRVTRCVYFSGWRTAFPFHPFPRCCFKGTSLLCPGVNDQSKWL